MSQIQNIIEETRRLAARQGWSKSRVAKEAELSENALRHLDDVDASFNSKTLEKLERLIASQNNPDANQ